MPDYERLRGFAAQTMSGAKTIPIVYSYTFPVGTAVWVCPKSGWWKFVLWGGGAMAPIGSTGGGSGAYYEALRHVAARQTVTFQVGDSGEVAGTRITLPGGEVLTALGVFNTQAGAAASPLNKTNDIALAGSAGAVGGAAATNGLGDNGGLGGTQANGGGGGAPGQGQFKGGDGAKNGSEWGKTPGGGSSGELISGFPGFKGGQGLALAVLQY